MRIAVLGAGSVGTCTALELASRGYEVDLYDELADPVAGASRHNEGKIHLGLVYAKDETLKTAKTMLVGALHFTERLARWIDVGRLADAISTPYSYAIHNETMTSVEDLERYYRECQRVFADAVSSTGLSYLGVDRALRVERLPRGVHEEILAPDQFLCSFGTSERAVDPRSLADLLGEAVHANSRIRFLGGARATGAERLMDDSIEIAFRLDGERHVVPYDQVVNALWHGRLEIDAHLGLVPERGWLFRHKMAGWIRVPVPAHDIPTLTIALGPFGDIVNYGGAGIYFSWYPAGLVGRSSDLRPPDWEATLSVEARNEISRESHERLAELCPALASLDVRAETITSVGGSIFAWGAADIDRPESELHSRYEIGIHSVRNYHSVNTGKYTMAPYLAFEAAERVVGAR